jgi:hypothetical protein
MPEDNNKMSPDGAWLESLGLTKVIDNDTGDIEWQTKSPDKVGLEVNEFALSIDSNEIMRSPDRQDVLNAMVFLKIPLKNS